MEVKTVSEALEITIKLIETVRIDVGHYEDAAKLQTAIQNLRLIKTAIDNSEDPTEEKEE